MTYLYLSRKDGKWARYDFEDISEAEDYWCFIEQVSPELWNALPPTSEFSTEAPSMYETFTRMDDLIAWADEANHENFLVKGDLPYGSEDFERGFDNVEDAIDYAEEKWYSLSDEDRSNAKIVIFRIVPYIDMVWSRGTCKE